MINLFLPMLAQAAAPAAGDGAIGGHWTRIDWSVLVGYLVFTTWIGHALSGKQATIRDFFLGGRKLPWYAVAGSIVATEISAVTFISVTAVVYFGDFTYLQLGLFGNLFARIIVGFVLVPQYYKREIYSPYDYMGNQLGYGVRSMTTALFSLGGLLAQSARVYLTAVVLELILRDELRALQNLTGISPIFASVMIIGAVAIAWTLMGGITTVIWTDVILFFVFLFGSIVALATVVYHIDGGFGQMLREAYAGGKFRFFDFDPDPTKAYTIFTAVIASTWGGINAYGTDQLMAQRMFCCKGPADARKAIIFSWLGIIVTITVMLVGAGLYVYYQHHPLTGEAAAAVAEKGDRIFPIFILTVIPTGLTGLIIAGVFAAAISSLDSILAALAQTSMSGFYLPLRQRHLSRKRGFPVGLPGDAQTAPENPQGPPDRPPTTPAPDPAEERHHVRVSRIFVIFWGIALCIMALLAEQAHAFYPSILDLALSMAGYAGGALLAGFLLAFLPLRINGVGYMWAAPLSVLTVVGLVWHQTWANFVCWIGAAMLLITWLIYLVQRPNNKQVNPILPTLSLLLGIAIMLLINHFGYFHGPIDPATGQPAVVTVAWPWYAPIGSLVAFIWGYLLAGPKDTPHVPPARAFEVVR